MCFPCQNKIKVVQNKASISIVINDTSSSFPIRTRIISRWIAHRKLSNVGAVMKYRSPSRGISIWRLAHVSEPGKGFDVCNSRLLPLHAWFERRAITQQLVADSAVTTSMADLKIRRGSDGQSFYDINKSFTTRASPCRILHGMQWNGGRSYVPCQSNYR